MTGTANVKLVLDKEFSDERHRLYKVLLDGKEIGHVRRGPGRGMTYRPWEAQSAVKRYGAPNGVGRGKAASQDFETRKKGVEWLVYVAAKSGEKA